MSLAIFCRGHILFTFGVYMRLMSLDFGKKTFFLMGQVFFWGVGLFASTMVFEYSQSMEQELCDLSSQLKGNLNDFIYQKEFVKAYPINLMHANENGELINFVVEFVLPQDLESTVYRLDLQGQVYRLENCNCGSSVWRLFDYYLPEFLVFKLAETASQENIAELLYYMRFVINTSKESFIHLNKFAKLEGTVCAYRPMFWPIFCNIDFVPLNLMGQKAAFWLLEIRVRDYFFRVDEGGCVYQIDSQGHSVNLYPIGHLSSGFFQLYLAFLYSAFDGNSVDWFSYGKNIQEAITRTYLENLRFFCRLKKSLALNKELFLDHTVRVSDIKIQHRLAKRLLWDYVERLQAKSYEQFYNKLKIEHSSFITHLHDVVSPRFELSFKALLSRTSDIQDQACKASSEVNLWKRRLGEDSLPRIDFQRHVYLQFLRLGSRLDNVSDVEAGFRNHRRVCAKVCTDKKARTFDSRPFP